MAAYVGFSTLFESKQDENDSVTKFLQACVFILLTICIILALISITSFITKKENVLQEQTIMTLC